MGPLTHTIPMPLPSESLKIWERDRNREAYHKGVPLLGVPGITLDLGKNITGSSGVSAGSS